MRVNFLPVGHTHEDIDQFFSRISTQLNQTGAETLPGKIIIIIIIIIHAWKSSKFLDLEAQISASSTPSAKVKIVDSILDVRSWIMPCLEGFHGHSGPHCFKFVADPTVTAEDSRVLMYYRNWCTDAWCETEEALAILKVHIFVCLHVKILYIHNYIPGCFLNPPQLDTIVDKIYMDAWEVNGTHSKGSILRDRSLSIH